MNEWAITEHLLTTRELLPPLQCDSVLTTQETLAGADAMLSAFLKGKPIEKFLFLIEIKSKSTPKTVHNAVAQIKAYHERKNDPEMHPMIVVPYLAEERLHELEEAGVSGIDLCGNGVINIPNRLYIFRTGQENQYPDARPVSNPFQGKTAMVARAFFTNPAFTNERSKFETLGELQQAVVIGGTKISLSQVSKAVSALEELRIIGSKGRAIYLLDPDQLLAKLAHAWKLLLTPPTFLTLGPDRMDRLTKLNQNPNLKWSISGESSVTHYTPFAQGGPIQVAVSNLSEAVELLGGKEERVPNFADVELQETDEPGYFFEHKIDAKGIRWASLLQTWIELKNGDARQQDAARAIHNLIIAPNS